MTIGLGVLCHGGDGIIMAADVRGSYQGSNPPKPHDGTSKQFLLPLGFIADIAGVIKVCDAFVAELYARMENIEPINGEIYHDHIRNAMNEAQFREYALRFDHELRMQLAITWEDWKSYEHSRQLYIEGKKILRQLDFPVEVIVGGFLNKRPVLINMHHKDEPEMTRNFAAIGSGSEDAWDVLDSRRQSEHMSFLRTLVHVCEALEAARMCNPASVGKPSPIVLLRPDGWSKRLDVNRPEVRALLAQYTGKDTAPLDTDVLKNREITALFYEDTPPLY